MKLLNKNNKAYTLIEMLVVVIIVFILISIIVPTTVVVQKRASGVACIGSLKQIHSALELYTLDSNYFYPKIRYNADGGNSYRWDVFLVRKGYVNVSNKNIAVDAAPGELFICPWHQKMAKRQGVTIKRSYGMNASMRKTGGNGTWDTAANDIHVKKQWCRVPYAEAILVAEANEGAEIADDWESVYNVNWGHVAWTRHDPRANYLFIDGHIESLLPAEAGNYFEWQ